MMASRKRAGSPKPAAAAAGRSPSQLQPAKKPAAAAAAATSAPRSQAGVKRNVASLATIRGWQRKHGWLRISDERGVCTPCTNAHGKAVYVDITRFSSVGTHAGNQSHKDAIALEGADADVTNILGRVRNIADTLKAAGAPALEAFEAKKVHLVRTAAAVLSKGRAMTDYESTVRLLHACGVDTGEAHASDDAGWEIGESIAAVLLSELKGAVAKARYVGVMLDASADAGGLDQMDFEVRFWDEERGELRVEHLGLVEMGQDCGAAAYEEVFFKAMAL